MDNSGHWHQSEEAALAANKRMDRFLPEDHPRRQRIAISIEIGEIVAIVKNGGDFLKATFDEAEKNRVALTPVDDGSQRPYLELAENVQIQRGNGENVNAQVWDNRDGKIILRTLPV